MSDRPQNKVLQQHKQSSNFWKSDLILQDFFHSNASEKGVAYLSEHLTLLGKRAATEMDQLSLEADKNPPSLVKRNFYGENIDEIRFHPSYDKLFQWAIDSHMFKVKWEPENRKEFAKERHLLGFTPFYLYAMAEGGIPCPLCMTDGAARLIRKFCSEEDQQRLLPKLHASSFEELTSGAMFLTEKSGGSDVGQNLVSATAIGNGYYHLNGEKWFCSNANADLIFVLARTNAEVKGTKGLSLFLVEKYLPNGSKNPLPVIRLKDKLGVKSMASAECMLTNTVGKLVGKEGEGFKLMSFMVNLSRLYNAITSVSFSRRAIAEAYQFQVNRWTFGKQGIQHGLVRKKLEELSALLTADFYLTWHAVQELDKADNGYPEASQAIRLLTPMVKRETAKNCVYIIRECMELMGGIGYIEDGVIPKLFRDSLVLPIWEGAGNIMILDMMRASVKSKGFEVLVKRLNLDKDQKPGPQFAKAMQLEEASRDAQMAEIFEQLTSHYKVYVLKKNLNESNKNWIEPTLNYLTSANAKVATPLSVETLENFIAWRLQ